MSENLNEMRRRWTSAVEERDEWKRRAEEAEARLALLEEVAEAVKGCPFVCGDPMDEPRQKWETRVIEALSRLDQTRKENA